MTSVFASRRRAEEFSSLVEAAATGQPRSGPADASVEEFLAIVESLRTVTAPEPRPDFVATLRAELMTAADTLLVPQDDARLTLPPRNARRDRRIAAAIGGLAVVGAGTSMAVAAQSALPGEMLYPLKRAIEDVEAGTASPEARGQTLLDQATSRLTEVQTLDREGHLTDDSLAVSSSFVDFGDQADQAADYILEQYDRTGDERLVRELRDFTGNSMDTLAALQAQVPDSARDELQGAVGVVTDIDRRAERACPGCGGRGVDQVPSVLLSSAATEGDLVVIPGATVETWSPSGDGRTRKGDRGATGGGGKGDGGNTSTTDPLVTAPDGGTTGDGGATDPLTDLTDAITGDGKTPASGGGVDVGGTVKDTTDGIKKGVKDVKDGVDDATGGATGGVLDDLTDPLTGD